MKRIENIVYTWSDEAYPTKPLKTKDWINAFFNIVDFIILCLFCIMVAPFVMLFDLFKNLFNTKSNERENSRHNPESKRVRNTKSSRTVSRIKKV